MKRIDISPARGERNARFGYGYQDKAVTELIFNAIKQEKRAAGPMLKGVRLADERAARVDDFVLVWENRVQGNSIKWRRNGKAMSWGDLIGERGILKELATGYQTLKQNWTNHRVEVRLQTSFPPSDSTSGRIVKGISLDEFVRVHWDRGPFAAKHEAVKAAWKVVKSHTNLKGVGLSEFVAACELALGVPEPGKSETNDADSQAYQRQFERLHSMLATWLSNHHESEMVERQYLLQAVETEVLEMGLSQEFPKPRIHYIRNEITARELERKVVEIDGGYLAVSGSAGGGKSTLVQDVLENNRSIVFVPYFVYLPDGKGNARERGEAIVFFKHVVEQLDVHFPDRKSIGVSSLIEGRQGLRRHMQSAHERFNSSRTKTVLLIDGLDHVIKERGIRESILHELPIPDEIPKGFMIILSARPEVFHADVINPDVSFDVEEVRNRRVVVGGLSREVVHNIISKTLPSIHESEYDNIHLDCNGNPLILNYILNSASTKDVDRTGEPLADYDGDIERFYSRNFSVPLSNSDAKKCLGLLCRSSFPFKFQWLQNWPEKDQLEELYRNLLTPFMTEEDGFFRFIHSSLVEFLRRETRSKIPGTSNDTDEIRYQSVLADRTVAFSCQHPFGRAHVSHLMRSGRKSEVLERASSRWLREAISGFLPHSLIRPVILESLRAAWDLEEYGHIVRLILVDAELSQRSNHLSASELARAFLKLGEDDLALAHFQTDGVNHENDAEVLAFSRELWFYAKRKNSDDLCEKVKKLYGYAKPSNKVLAGVDSRTDSIEYELDLLLRPWCSASPLFESIDQVIGSILAVDLTPLYQGEQIDEARERADFLLESLRTVVQANLGEKAESSLFDAICELDVTDMELSALLLMDEYGETSVSARELIDGWSRCEFKNDLALDVAERLYITDEIDKSSEIVFELVEKYTDFIRTSVYLDEIDVNFIRRLTCLCELHGLSSNIETYVLNAEDEGVARIIKASQIVGMLDADSRRGSLRNGFRDRYRDVIFFQNRPIVRNDTVSVFMFTRPLLRELIDVARSFRRVEINALRDIVFEAASNTSLGGFRRTFARLFWDKDVLTQDEAIDFGLSSSTDLKDEEPRVRQEACLEIAAFVQKLGSEKWNDWVDRAAQVSAGTGGYGDYRMEHLTHWLDEAVGSEKPSIDLVRVMRKFLQALEISGGDGVFEAAKQLLMTVLRVMPANAPQLAIEIVNRDLVRLHVVLEALVRGGAQSGASPHLLKSVFEELLSLVLLDGLGDTANAVLEAFEKADRLGVAQDLISRVRTNGLPSLRLRNARTVQQALGKWGFDEIDVAEGMLGAGSEHLDDRDLYKLEDGRHLTTAQIGARACIAGSSGEEMGSKSH